MKGEQIAEQIAYMAKVWRVEFTPGQTEIWVETLGDLEAAHARSAFRKLKEVAEFLPSHAAFLEAYRLAKRRHDESSRSGTAERPVQEHLLSSEWRRLTPEERAANLERVREIKALINKSTMVEGGA